jgi:putative heme-binding domain-containing protein
MKSLSTIVTTAALILLAVQKLEGQDTDRDWAVAAVWSLGGRVEFDETDPRKPVVSVDLDFNYPHDADLAYFKGLTSLRTLKLHAAVDVTDKGLRHLSALTELRELDLSRTEITGDGLRYLQNLKKLKILRLFGNRLLRDESLAYLKNLSSLEVLDLDACEHVTDSSVVHLKNVTTLRQLNLASTDITKSGLMVLRGLPNLRRIERSMDHRLKKAKLRELYLTRENIPKGGLKEVRGLNKVEELSFYRTQLSDADLAHVGKLTQLRKLSINYASISNEGMHHLSGLKGLNELDLDESEVSHAAIREFQEAAPNVKLILWRLKSTGVERHSRDDEADEDQESEKEDDSSALVLLVGVLNSTSDASVHRDILRGMCDALQGRRNVKAPKGWAAVYKKLAASKDVDVREKALTLSVLFGNSQALLALRKAAADARADEAARRRALQTLVEKRPADLLPLLRDLLADKAMRGPALRGLAALDDPETPALVLGRYTSLSDAEKSDAVATLASRPRYALALLEAMEKGKVPRRDLSAFTARQLLLFKDKTLTEKLGKVWGSIRSPSRDLAASLARYKKLVTPGDLKKADRRHGRLVFAKTCANCHLLFDAGGKIGPELTGSQRANPEYILTKVLDPNAVVGQDYQVTRIVTTGGRVISGIIKEENDKTIAVQTPTEVIRLPKTDIDERTRLPVSMMPENQLAMLSDAEVRDLIAYLAGPGQVALPGD